MRITKERAAAPTAKLAAERSALIYIYIYILITAKSRRDKEEVLCSHGDRASRLQDMPTQHCALSASDLDLYFKYCGQVLPCVCNIF